MVPSDHETDRRIAWWGPRRQLQDDLPACFSVPFATAKRITLLPLCFHLLGSIHEVRAEQHASSTEDSPDSWRCPKCGGPMKVIERLTAAEIQLRSPPVVAAAA
jgi:hypothetical protein